jgi:hypothetical protein
MLVKKILVFPSNLNDVHSTVTFVFNASYIIHDVDAEVVLDGDNLFSFGIVALLPMDHNIRPLRKGFLGF